MPTRDVSYPQLLAWVDGPDAVQSLVTYFEPGRDQATAPAYSGSRFEFLGGGGDRPEVADTITAEDLIAVMTLSVDVPGHVAVDLLEGELGRELTRWLWMVPTDVAITDVAAAELLGAQSAVHAMWVLLREQRGVDWVKANKILARKRPALIPVYDSVVQCLLGGVELYWEWLLEAMRFQDGAVPAALHRAQLQAGVDEHVTPLRVLDVILWMRHQGTHKRNGCPGA